MQSGCVSLHLRLTHYLAYPLCAFEVVICACLHIIYCCQHSAHMNAIDASQSTLRPTDMSILHMTKMTMAASGLAKGAFLQPLVPYIYSQITAIPELAVLAHHCLLWQCHLSCNDIWMQHAPSRVGMLGHDIPHKRSLHALVKFGNAAQQQHDTIGDRSGIMDRSE